MTANHIAIGVDIGGTKVLAAAIDASGQVLSSVRLPTDAPLGGVHVLSVIESAVSQLLGRVDRARVVGFGISSAGVIDPATGEVLGAAPSLPGWEGQVLGAHFEARFGWPVVADNDANCALLGEVWRGGHSLPPGPDVVMITLGTGLGGAVMVGGELVLGAHMITGHFGMAKCWDPDSNALERVEHLVSGTGLGNIYAQMTGSTERVSGKTVMAKHDAGEPLATRALARWCEHVALQLHNIHWACDPHAILIGGGMIDVRDKWWSRVEREIESLGVNVTLLPAALGNEAGAFGAARRVFDAHDAIAPSALGGAAASP